MDHSVKLFVGQVPRTMTEDGLKPYFEEFGDVNYVRIIRDKSTDAHKGCAFVTYSNLDHAEKAVKAMHNTITLPSMSHPMQIKPAHADDLSKLERRIFIGMFSKGSDENDMRAMFEKYGTIVDLNILRDDSGTSKGCGFIRFESALQCTQAIQEMHHSTTMQGCSNPLVVKFADTDKDRVARKSLKRDANDSHNFGTQALIKRATPVSSVPQSDASSIMLGAMGPLLQHIGSQNSPGTTMVLAKALGIACRAIADSCDSANSINNNAALVMIASQLSVAVSNNLTNQGNQHQEIRPNYEEHQRSDQRSFSPEVQSGLYGPGTFSSFMRSGDSYQTRDPRDHGAGLYSSYSSSHRRSYS